MQKQLMKTIKIGNITIQESDFDSFVYLYTRFIEKDKSKTMRWRGFDIEAGVASILVSNINRELGYSKRRIELSKKYI